MEIQEWEKFENGDGSDMSVIGALYILNRLREMAEDKEKRGIKYWKPIPFWRTSGFATFVMLSVAIGALAIGLWMLLTQPV